MSLKRFEIEKVYFVASQRDHQTGEIIYDIMDNLSKLPRGWRPVFGTGNTNLEVVKRRLTQCDKGIWFKSEHKRRRKREAEDARYRRNLHERYLERHSKTGFDWSKYENMLKV